MNKTIILASKSPRRQQLLKAIGLNFKIIVPTISETSLFKKPSLFVKKLAYEKALETKKKLDSKAIIIAADTIVFCKNEIIGKPNSKKDAKRILNKIIKYPQTVYTGFSIIDLYTNKTYTSYEKTTVIMHKIPKTSFEKIIAENMDKAGCYAIQSKDKLVKSIKGDYFNVVGLPVARIIEILKDYGIKIDENKYKTLVEVAGFEPASRNI